MNEDEKIIVEMLKQYGILSTWAIADHFGETTKQMRSKLHKLRANGVIDIHKTTRANRINWRLVK